MKVILNENIEGLGTIGDLGQSFIDLQGESASSKEQMDTLNKQLENSIQKLGEDASDEDKAAFFNALGRPEEATGYDLKKPDLPEGLIYDEAMEGRFRDAAHKFGLSQAQAEAGTDSSTLMTPQRTEQHMVANALGWGQTWQDVTGSRAQNTSYQNTTGRPIQLAVLNRGSGGTRFQVSSNNATWIDVAYATSGGFQYNTSFVVPNGWYYRANTTTMTIDSWAELR